MKTKVLNHSRQNLKALGGKISLLKRWREFCGGENLLIIVFRTINNYPPEYLRDLFGLRDNIKNLRGANKLQVPKPNTTRYGENTVKYLAAITWNKVSDTLRSLSSLSVFRKAVRQLRF